ncbi:MAG: NAD(P)H-hydrate dehydratase [Bacteroidetes bacterium]|nr:NAD(P)H-hydrate dehydratase [Bacteroidota bacterium]MBK8146400.1 NAD(P)H-hydrate dehydratase [Bacteroidota bacterium]MBP6314801.1 NAD(P)H-hydrate dehydratase [Chitinophagaceae bacterium]
MTLLTKAFIGSLYHPRVTDSHKGDHGHVLLVAGSADKMGAAVIAARACLRSGAGLLTIRVARDAASVIQMAIPEAMLLFSAKKKIDFLKYTAVGIGPGIGVTTESLKVVQQVLKHCTLPVIYDADALNHFSTHPSLWLKAPTGSIITPHAREFDRLFGPHASEKDRIQTATQKSKEFGIIIVLKSHRTHIFYQGKIYKNTTGNAGLAKGGSGDALSGIIASFLAQGYEAIHAALLGVYIHGLAADITLHTQSLESMLITDVIENLGMAFKSLQKK